MSHALAEHFFRRSYSVMVASLCRQFGVDHLELIEDAVQSALVQAMQSWRKGPPDNPTAWLKRVASNRMLDHFRHHQVVYQSEAKLQIHLELGAASTDNAQADSELNDDVLRLMFVVCHPALNQRSRIMMALKHLCGFSNEEIARGLLMSREAIKKQLQRAARQLRELQLELDLPPAVELSERLTAVHAVLYMVFNEGYSSASAEQVIREDVCAEAARLTHLLATHTIGNADTRALLALMMLHAARLPSRVDHQGNTLLLAEQDRRLWDQDVILEAGQWLRSAFSDTGCRAAAGRYQWEGMIALIHSTTRVFEDTPWERIVMCYDTLIRLNDSPVYRVNRAIALAQVHGADQALAELERMDVENPYYPGLDCARAWLLERAGRRTEALRVCQNLLTTALAPHERRLMAQQCGRLAEQKE